MGLNHKNVLGVKINVNSEEEVLEYIEKYLNLYSKKHKTYNKKTLKSLVIFTPNPEIINLAQKDPKFHQVVNTAQINIPDGAGIVWALENLYNIKISRITGIDLMEKLCRLAAEKRLRVGVIGGRGGVALKALECLKNAYANLSGWAEEGPFIKISNSKFLISNQIQNTKFQKAIKQLIIKIKKEKTSIIFVGMGFPKQEYFINSVARLASSVEFKRPLVLMAVGGAFDYISGRVPRAPSFLRDRGLEWLYRLIREPWRIKRQLMGAQFFFDVIRHGG